MIKSSFCPRNDTTFCVPAPDDDDEDGNEYNNNKINNNDNNNNAYIHTHIYTSALKR